MSDPLERPLSIPSWQIPYLEKHQIYELFQELTKELVIQQPEDHVLFLKQILLNAAHAKDTTRVIILNPPSVNNMEIASEISKMTGQIVISEYTLSKYMESKEKHELSPLQLAKFLAYITRTENAYKMGWIMVGCIRNAQEAKAVLAQGILPTHVIHLIPPFHPDLNQLLYCNISAEWPDYRRKILELKAIFSNVLKELYMKDKTLYIIVLECISIMKTRKGHNFIKPRVLILGPRGSGRNTQAELLKQQLNLVHVDFETVICQAWMSENELGEKIRRCKSKVCFHSELLTEIINERLLKEDCLSQGWVLTGFPYTVSDFKYLDSIDTPPSKVIFLDCDLNVCLERLRYRKRNVYTGSIVNFKDTSDLLDIRDYKTHPRDNLDLIHAEYEYYCENYGSLKMYCGNTATVINADQGPRYVNESILSVLVKSLPPGSPRKGLSDADTKTTPSDSCECIPIPNKVKNNFILNL